MGSSISPPRGGSNGTTGGGQNFASDVGFDIIKRHAVYWWTGDLLHIIYSDTIIETNTNSTFGYKSNSSLYDSNSDNLKGGGTNNSKGVDITTELAALNVTMAKLAQYGYWVGKTKKGKYKLYNINNSQFGNQWTNNTGFFKKAGIVGLFVGTSSDFYNYYNGNITANQLTINTSLGVASLLIPEVGVGFLIYGGAEFLSEVNRAFWASPAGQRIDYNINRAIYETGDPRNWGAPDDYYH